MVPSSRLSDAIQQSRKHTAPSWLRRTFDPAQAAA
jgi:hypothetical protein